MACVSKYLHTYTHFSTSGFLGDVLTNTENFCMQWQKFACLVHLLKGPICHLLWDFFAMVDAVHWNLHESQSNLKSLCCWGKEYDLRSATFSQSVPSQWVCLLERVTGWKAIMVHFSLLPDNEVSIRLFFSPACPSALASGYAFSVFTNVCIWQTFPMFFMWFQLPNNLLKKSWKHTMTTGRNMESPH